MTSRSVACSTSAAGSAACRRRLSRVVAEWLGAEEVHGIDIDEAVLAEAIGKGVRAVQHDVASSPLPYSSGYFDLVITLGMMDTCRRSTA